MAQSSLYFVFSITLNSLLWTLCSSRPRVYFCLFCASVAFTWASVAMCFARVAFTWASVAMWQNKFRSVLGGLVFTLVEYVFSLDGHVLSLGGYVGFFFLHFSRMFVLCPLLILSFIICFVLFLSTFVCFFCLHRCFFPVPCGPISTMSKILPFVVWLKNYRKSFLVPEPTIPRFLTSTVLNVGVPGPASFRRLLCCQLLLPMFLCTCSAFFKPQRLRLQSRPSFTLYAGPMK